MEKTTDFRPVYYMQTDSKWADIPYQTTGETTTIGRSGCGPTAAAMVLATYVDPDITPVESCDWAVKHGYKALNQGTYYSFFKAYFKEYGITCEQLNGSDLYGRNNASATTTHGLALSELMDGKMIIACMGKSKWTSSGHFVLWYNYDGKNVYLNDPNHNDDDHNIATYAEFRNAVKYYWVIDVPFIFEFNNAREFEITATDGYMNLRPLPSTWNSPVAQVNTGETVYADAFDGTWYRCCYIDKDNVKLYGYINKSGMLEKVVAPWYDNIVTDLKNKGIIKGDSNGNFDPEKTATLAEVSSMVYNMMNYILGQRE